MIASDTSVPCRFYGSFVSLLLGLAILSNLLAEEAVEIEFHLVGGEITWQQIWDAGFRPVHHMGGETHCKQTNVALTIRYRDEAELFDLGVGDVQFVITEGEEVYQINFYGKRLLTLQEGSRQIESFSRVFSQILDKTGIPLRALDSADTVDATAGTDTSVASYGQYRIMHTFNSSFRAKTPLLEQFLITLRLGDERIKRRTTLLEPPAGYENSSMEPMAVRVPADSRAEVKTEPPQGKSSGSMPVWKWGIVLVLVFVCIVAWIARMCWSRRRDELDSEN